MKDAGLSIVAGIIQTALNTLVDPTSPNWLPPSGNVGFGALPDCRFTVSDNPIMPAPISGTVMHYTGADGQQARFLMDTFANIPQFTGRRANGTAAAPSALATNDAIF